jgi:hypothetical protein
MRADEVEALLEAPLKRLDPRRAAPLLATNTAGDNYDGGKSGSSSRSTTMMNNSHSIESKRDRHYDHETPRRDQDHDCGSSISNRNDDYINSNDSNNARSAYYEDRSAVNVADSERHYRRRGTRVLVYLFLHNIICACSR